MTDFSDPATDKALNVLELLHADFIARNRNFDCVIVEECIDLLRKNNINVNKSNLNQTDSIESMNLSGGPSCFYIN
ncbi:hypothetical protein AEP_01690 [Curvibacter sp. AEP1-3]|nr:hypothetical protein AEP_01690 [Curvibacter sp. AEP1-3]